MWNGCSSPWIPPPSQASVARIRCRRFWARDHSSGTCASTSSGGVASSVACQASCTAAQPSRSPSGVRERDRSRPGNSRSSSASTKGTTSTPLTSSVPKARSWLSRSSPFSSLPRTVISLMSHWRSVAPRKLVRRNRAPANSRLFSMVLMGPPRVVPLRILRGRAQPRHVPRDGQGTEHDLSSCHRPSDEGSPPFPQLYITYIIGVVYGGKGRGERAATARGSPRLLTPDPAEPAVPSSHVGHDRCTPRSPRFATVVGFAVPTRRNP